MHKAGGNKLPRCQGFAPNWLKGITYTIFYQENTKPKKILFKSEIKQKKSEGE